MEIPSSEPNSLRVSSAIHKLPVSRRKYNARNISTYNFTMYKDHVPNKDKCIDVLMCDVINVTPVEREREREYEKTVNVYLEIYIKMRLHKYVGSYVPPCAIAEDCDIVNPLIHLHHVHRTTKQLKRRKCCMCVCECVRACSYLCGICNVLANVGAKLLKQ